MVVVQLNMKWLFLTEPQLLAGPVPKLTALCRHFRGYYAVEDYHTLVWQNTEDLLHDFFQASSVPPYEDGIRTGNCGNVGL